MNRRNMKLYKIFAINPGSTSTKIALFNDEEMVFSKNYPNSFPAGKRQFSVC